MLHESNNIDVSRSSVSRPTHVQSAVHSSDVQQHGANQSRARESTEQAWRDRVQRFEAVLREVVEGKRTAERDYNRLYDGYEALVKAHADLLYELALVKDENIRFPFFTLPENVAVDVVDQLMEII